MLGNGSLDISEMHTTGVAIGSLEGDGVVVLGSKNLSVGSNKLSTTFAGTIVDGEGFSGGSLTKTGLDSLVLTNANTYTGGTTLEGSATNRGQATLEIDNANGSGTGSGPVSVLGGALRGRSPSPTRTMGNLSARFCRLADWVSPRPALSRFKKR